MSEFSPQHSQGDIDYLLSPRAIREQTKKLFDLSLQGKTHFEIRLDKLDEVAEFVTNITLQNYPDLELPFHSRWGHFQTGGVDRLAQLDNKLAGLSKQDVVRAKLDLVVTSVLLDAGAGANWAFTEVRDDGTRLCIGRSEGLAVASFYLFMEGAFSSNPAAPFQADALGLQNLTLEKLGEGFGVSESNKLVGLEGRLELLRALGRALESQTKYFGEALPRPGGLFDFLSNQGQSKTIEACALLDAVLRGLGPIWPGRLSLSGVPLGDVWRHGGLGPLDSVDCLVPFHKLSQWLSYSMMEPLQEAGCTIVNVDGLTGLAEYRNGGLLVDLGFLNLRNADDLLKSHKPDSELIIEWRALTLHSLDLIAPKVRTLLNKSESDFPLAKVLEGGTWRAGRQIASELRAGGRPPIALDSDGTVF